MTMTYNWRDYNLLQSIRKLITFGSNSRFGSINQNVHEFVLILRYIYMLDRFEYRNLVRVQLKNRNSAEFGSTVKFKVQPPLG